MRIPNDFSATPRWSGLMTLAVGATLALGAGSLSAQELIYQEGFNTDGDPSRYTTTGHDVFELPRIFAELAAPNNTDQKGPIYWARNTEVSFVGVPNIPARRMIFTMRPGTDPAAFTPDLVKLLNTSINWLLEGKTKAVVTVSPNVAAIGVLGDLLAAAGHTLVDDDPAVNDPDIKADLYIHGIGGTSSRYAMVPKPVICLSSAEYDDLLLAGIGLANVSFAPGQINIATPGHPAAAGVPASFNGFTGTGNQAFELINRFLAPNAITLATVNRTVAPTVARLPDADEIIAGIRTSTNATAKVAEIDFSNNSGGNWPYDNPIPGGYAGIWALQVKGKLSVSAAGTYRFAIGSDNGARFQIDRDKNGITDADTVIQDFGPHGHAIEYVDVAFAAPGTYDFEIRSFNNGGNGDLEASVAIQAGEIPDDALDSGYWEPLGGAGATSPVKLVGTADATAYNPIGANTIERQPLIVLFNGPNDTPPGNFNGGGPFIGFEGTGFYAGAGMNKWAFPDTQTYRSLRLKPVSVAGKKDVKLTVALAAAQIDNETSDFLDIFIYPTGANSTPIRLAHFRGVEDVAQPWLADQQANYNRRLTRDFADFTYNIPTNATDLIVEFRVATTWWNEILALDNVRITSGAITTPPPATSVNLSGVTANATSLTINWSGGTGPYIVQRKASLSDAAWVTVLVTTNKTATVAKAGATAFFRVTTGTATAATSFKAVLNGAGEVPAVTTLGTGFGVFTLDGTTLTYSIAYTGLSGTASAAHIHGPATATATAGVLIPFTLSPAGSSGFISGTATLTAQQVTYLTSGMLYANIHTAANGGGEIRGQILP
jgi:hypothetical protein